MPSRLPLRKIKFISETLSDTHDACKLHMIVLNKTLKPKHSENVSLVSSIFTGLQNSSGSEKFEHRIFLYYRLAYYFSVNFFF